MLKWSVMDKGIDWVKPPARSEPEWCLVVDCSVHMLAITNTMLRIG